MKAEGLHEAAKSLLASYASKQPLRPLRERFPDLTIEDGYWIQQEQIKHWTANGARICGHKVGLSSTVMQRQMGVDQPDYGHLLDDMFILEHESIPWGRFLQPRVEPEIAFVLAKPLIGPGVTVADAVDAVKFVLPALELIDSRIQDWNISIVDTVADNASSGGVVLGGKPASLHDIDLRLTGCVLHCNGELIGTGAGAAVLDSPLNALVWLANTLGPLGVRLEPGYVVLPGSMTASVPAGPGDKFVLTVAGLGAVSATFGTEELEGSP